MNSVPALMLRKKRSSQTDEDISNWKDSKPSEGISHLIGPYLTPEKAHCGVKSPTLSLGGPISSLRVGPFTNMKRLIRELRSPRMGEGKRSKVYQKARERPVTYLSDPLFAKDGPPQV